MCVLIRLFTRERFVIPADAVVTSSMDVARPYADVKARIEARFGSKLPKHFRSAMSKPQNRPYMHGDVHNVTYRDQVQEPFNQPMPVSCEVTIQSCRRFDDNSLVLGADCASGIDEPLPWMDAKYQVTLNFLRSLLDGTKLLVYTRSDLVAHDDYLEQLKRLDVRVNLLYASRNDALNRRREPGAPSFARRKAASEKLKQASIECYLIRHSIPMKQQKGA